MEDVLEVLARLVSFNTDTENGKEFRDCAEFIASCLEQFGEVELLGKRDRPNIVAEIDGEEPCIGFCCHYDVVPAGDGWKYDPWKLTVVNGRAFGRGASDDKGNIACLISALRKQRPRNKVKIVITCDEERGGKDGLLYLFKEHREKIHASLYYVLDHGPEYAVIACSGVLEGVLRIFGKGGHAGYDFKCDNPVWKLCDVLKALEEYKRKRERVVSRIMSEYNKPVWGRFNVTVVNGGFRANMIPDYVNLSFDIRTIPEENVEDVRKEFEEFLRENLKVRFELRWIASLNGCYVDEKYAEHLRSIVKKVTGRELPIYGVLGGSDASYFVQNGIPAILYGCLRGDNNVHAPNEFVYVEDLKLLERVLIEMFKSRHPTP